MSRTKIEIDDKLMRKARKLSGAKTKWEAVHRALELLVRRMAQTFAFSFAFRSAPLEDGCMK